MTDITVLQGMPLKRLRLDVTKVTDISVLKGMPLEDLILPERATDIEFLRKIPTLQRINEKPAAQFWKEFDAVHAEKAKEGKK